MKAKILLIFMCVVVVISFTSAARSLPWITEEDNNIAPEINNSIIIGTNETKLTPEEKETLRIKNNLEIGKLMGTLTPAQEQQLEDIEKAELKKERELNQGFFKYVILVFVILAFILWMIHLIDS